VIKQLLHHNDFNKKSSNRLSGFAVTLLISSFLMSNLELSACGNVGQVLLEFLTFHSTANHQALMFAPSGILDRKSFSIPLDDALFVVNPITGNFCNVTHK
jgi:hypothetical protein